jgi:benzoyl-CoA reductase/2-hydroxyglutaryl-CoA dehydratase subunit BcrC/BadD/HgdB
MMTTVAYCHPLVPPEWIAAHGLRPHWLRLRVADSSPAVARGVCPYAAAMAEAIGPPERPFEAARSRPFDIAVATTACDQMRYAAALAEQAGAVPLFLMNVPSTWQTATARAIYRDELRRLGRFFEHHGGSPPRPEHLATVMRRYGEVRAAIQAGQSSMSARLFAEALVGARGEIASAPTSHPAADGASRRGVPLALVGGPLLEADFELYDLIEEAGGRIVLDATEGGQRTLPDAFDEQRLCRDPFEELARAYFDAFPDVFRRPNDGFYQWLGRETASRGVRGLLFRRYVWCDLWHAELARLRARSPVPVLDLDASPDDPSARARTLNRVEAFLETIP